MVPTTDEPTQAEGPGLTEPSAGAAGFDPPSIWSRLFHAVRRWCVRHSYALAGWGNFLFIIVARWAHDSDPHEMIYLLGSRRIADPSFLGADFTWAPLPPTTTVFDHLFAPLWSFMTEPAIVALGRCVTWGLLAWSISHLAKALKLPAWAAFLGFSLWLAWGQTLTVCGSLIEGFQVKSFSYPLIFFGIALVLRGRVVWAGLLLGLATVFHIIVGGWGFLCLLFAMLVNRRYFTLRQCAAFVLAATPLVAPLVLSVLIFHEAHVAHAVQAQMDEIYVTFAMPHCCDPTYFMSVPRALRVVVALAISVLVIYAWPYRRGARVIGAINLAMIGCFALGELASAGRLYAFLKLYPLQMAAALSPLFMFMFLIGLIGSRWPVTWRGRIAGVLVLLGVTWLLVERKVVEKLVEIPDDFYFEMIEYRWPIKSTHGSLYRWIRKDTPRNSVFITPFLFDFWPYAERSQIASMRHPPLDKRIIEWKQRLEALNRFRPFAKRGFGIREDLEISESLLSREELVRIRGLYHATHYLVAGERADLKAYLLFSGDGYSVYDVTRL